MNIQYKFVCITYFIVSKMDSTCGCVCGCVQQFVQQAKDLENDLLLEGDEISPNFGTLLNDQIIVKWTEQFGYWDDINKCVTLKQLFLNIMDQHKTSSGNTHLFRGVDLPGYKNLQVNDIIDYSSRCTAWSARLGISINFIDPEFPIILVYNGHITGLNISKLNRDEYEWILPFNKFKVTRVINFHADTNNHKDLKVIYKKVFDGHSVDDNVSDTSLTLCKIYYVDLI